MVGFAPPSTLAPSRTMVAFTQSATVEAPKADKLSEMSEDDADLVQVILLVCVFACVSDAAVYIKDIIFRGWQ